MGALDKMIYRLLRKGELPYLTPLGKSQNSVTVLMKDGSGDILLCTGTTKPTDATDGFAKGCIFIDTDAVTTVCGVYLNNGTSSSCIFELAGTVGALSIATGNIIDAAVTFAKMQALATGSIICGAANVPAALVAKTSGQILVGNGTTLASVAVSGDATLANTGALTLAANAVTSAKLDEKTIQYAEVAITKAQIIGTGAGQLGHAQGLELVAAPGATKVLELISAILIFDYATAAYDGGGNVSVCWGAGGAALTGIATFANSLGAGADTMNRFTPLTTAAVAMVANKGLNLVVAAAPTDTGGTAAGVARVKVAYRVHTHGL